MFKRHLLAGFALCTALAVGCTSANTCRNCGPAGPTIVGSAPVVASPGPCCNGSAPPPPQAVPPSPFAPQSRR